MSQMSSANSGHSRLGNKVAIVTGGGSGYGEGIAVRFAAEGANVVVADINKTGGLRVVATNPEKLLFCEMDVTKKEDWQKVMALAVEKWGRVDILVNNAGASYRNKSTLDVTEAEFDICFNVNVKSVFHSVSGFITPLVDSSSPGVMLNISSTGSLRPRPGLVWYNASKAAVSNATKALAAEYGPKGIRVNAICPLLGATGLFETFTGLPNTKENQAAFLGNVPMGRLCTPNDVSSAALFLCSDEAAFVTGVCMEVDGGKCV